MKLIFAQFLREKERGFAKGFRQIGAALQKGNEITPGLQTIGGTIGVSVAFESVDEVEARIKSGGTFHW